jgi:hypothetical protein
MKHIIFVGHGAGCWPIIETLAQRCECSLLMGATQLG